MEGGQGLEVGEGPENLAMGSKPIFPVPIPFPVPPVPVPVPVPVPCSVNKPLGRETMGQVPSSAWDRDFLWDESRTD